MNSNTSRNRNKNSNEKNSRFKIRNSESYSYVTKQKKLKPYFKRVKPYSNKIQHGKDLKNESRDNLQDRKYWEFKYSSISLNPFEQINLFFPFVESRLLYQIQNLNHVLYNQTQWNIQKRNYQEFGMNLQPINTNNQDFKSLNNINPINVNIFKDNIVKKPNISMDMEKIQPIERSNVENDFKLLLEYSIMKEQKNFINQNGLKHYFQNLNYFLINYFLLNPISQSSVDKLSKLDLEITFILLCRQNKNITLKFSEFNVGTFKKYQKVVTKKRNEEKIKQIWKRFLKKEFQEFCLNELYTEKEIRDNQISNLRSKDDWKRFFVFFFKDLIEKKYPLDYILDICAEKIIKQKNAKQHVPQNWKTIKKFRMMRKISASFRYLISSDSKLRKKFLSFLLDDKKGNILWVMKTITVNKINRIIRQWTELYNKVGEDDVTFLQEWKKICQNPKFKMPWMLSDIKEAIEFCIDDLDSEKLAKEFNYKKEFYF